jgi:peptidoglycan/xylan/chitin deacetylase (PgdA/CDA1 family)
MNEHELQHLCQHPLITIGGHTSSHLRMPNETTSTLEEDILKNKQYLEQFTGYPLRHFAYPEGFTDDRSATIIKNCGYNFGYLATPVKQFSTNYMAIPRIGVYRNGLGYLAAKLFTS